jgi:hypothetical protein
MKCNRICRFSTFYKVHLHLRYSCFNHVQVGCFYKLILVVSFQIDQSYNLQYIKNGEYGEE